jgi:hypothetical protein
MEVYGPVIWTKDLLRRMNETWFGIGWRVHNLAGEFVRGSHDDEALGQYGKTGDQYQKDEVTNILKTLSALKSPKLHCFL